MSIIIGLEELGDGECVDVDLPQCLLLNLQNLTKHPNMVKMSCHVQTHGNVWYIKTAEPLASPPQMLTLPKP